MNFPRTSPAQRGWLASLIPLLGVCLASVSMVSCGGGNKVSATNSSMPGDSVSVAVAKAVRKTLEQHLTVSSELVPYQETDVYAKESGFVKNARRGLRNPR